MTRTEREVSSGGVIIKRHGTKLRVLLIRDPYGKWTWPKGKIDKGETPVEAARREIEEETGLKSVELISKLGRTNYFYTRKNLIYKTVHLYLFKFTGREAVVVDKSEIEDGRWFAVEQALSLVSYEGAKAFLRKAITNFRKNEKA